MSKNNSTTETTEQKPEYHDWISVSQPTWEAIQEMIKDVVRTEIQTYQSNMMGNLSWKDKGEISVLQNIEKKLLKKWEEF